MTGTYMYLMWMFTGIPEFVIPDNLPCTSTVPHLCLWYSCEHKIFFYLFSYNIPIVQSKISRWLRKNVYLQIRDIILYLTKMILRKEASMYMYDVFISQNLMSHFELDCIIQKERNTGCLCTPRAQFWYMVDWYYATNKNVSDQ